MELFSALTHLRSEERNSQVITECFMNQLTKGNHSFLNGNFPTAFIDRINFVNRCQICDGFIFRCLFQD